MKTNLLLVLVSTTMLLVCGCGRHVVVDPSGVGGLKDSEWTVKGEPHSESGSDQPGGGDQR